jgi:hypothetical protein
MSVSERMRKDALLLKPGQAVTGSFSFDSKVFSDNLKSGTYRLEAVLYGWNLLFDNSQLSELAGMGAPFLIGESTASLPVELRGGGRLRAVGKSPCHSNLRRASDVLDHFSKCLFRSRQVKRDVTRLSHLSSADLLGSNPEMPAKSGGLNRSMQHHLI